MQNITCFDSCEKDLYDECTLSASVLKRHTRVINVSKAARISGAAGSKGNQVKWKTLDSFIKLDCLGYEAVAEIAACWVLKYVRNLRFDYVRYYPCLIVEDGIVLGNGCYSKLFLDGCEEVTVAKILQDNLLSFSIKYDDLRDVILDETGLDVKDYLDTILCLDAITRNEDRHFGNVALLLGDSYRPAPIFDNGAAFLSDVVTYPFSASFEDCFDLVQAKPFSVDFNRQIGSVVRLTLDDELLLGSIDATGSAELTRVRKTLEYSLEESRNVAWEKV